ncbi:hypothetical protein AB0K12_42505 [Nonomuraea sp. NPDC049419]|uniref:hypothetical protein n=1 Tax=Nonomuraea sp. NPDC049419 TaxID=3155772 RepID=UPI0034126B77
MIFVLRTYIRMLRHRCEGLVAEFLDAVLEQGGGDGRLVRLALEESLREALGRAVGDLAGLGRLVRRR